MRPPPRRPAVRTPLLPAVLVLQLFLAGVSARAATIIVPDDHPRIQAAIAASSQGDSVLVRSGSYVENLVIVHDLTLIGLEEPTIPLIHGHGDPDSSAVEVRSPARVSIARFQISGGLGRAGTWLPPDSEFPGSAIWGRPGTELWLEDLEIVQNGGMLCSTFLVRTGGVSADLIHASRCSFVQNIGAGAVGIGGLFAERGEVRDCVFTGNVVNNDPCPSGTVGGALAFGGPLLFERCRFEANSATGALALVGNATLRDCEFVDHVSDAGSGAVVDFSGDVVEGCRFAGNVNVGGGTPSVLLLTSENVSLLGSSFTDNEGFVSTLRTMEPGVPLTATITECLFARNTAVETAGIRADGDVSVRNCTFVDLEGSQGAALFAPDNSSSITMHRSIVAQTRGGPAVSCADSATTDFDCNDFWDNETPPDCPQGPNSFSADPLFCDPGASDYTLRSDSPCAPEHSGGCDQVGAFGVACTPPIGIADAGETAAAGLRLHPIAPHPSRGRAVVRFEVGRAGPITLTVMDPAGRLVRTLAARPHAPGRHAIAWDGRDERGRSVPAGIYFLRLQAGPERVTRKLILIP